MSLKRKVEKKKKPTRRQLREEARRTEQENRLACEAGIRTTAGVSSREEGFPLVKYIVNGIIVFLALYGSLGSFASAFGLPGSRGLVFFLLFLFSMLLSFMYYRQSIKIMVYLGILGLSIVAVTRLFIVMNSGFSAIQNIILNQIGDTFTLTNIREFTEFYPNRNISIPVAIFFVGVALGVFINILISEYMNIWVVSLVIIPIGFYGSYFGFEGDKLSMAALLVCLVMMIGIRFTGFYQGLENVTRFHKKINGNRIRYAYSSDPQNNGLIGVSFLLIGAGLLLCFFLIFQDKYMEIKTPVDGLKKRTEEPMRQLLSVGISAWIPELPWDLTSGDGQLNTAGRVRQDGQVDLKVSFVPYTAGRMYLRNYIGGVYHCYGYQWEQINYSKYRKEMQQAGLEDGTGEDGSIARVNNETASLLSMDSAKLGTLSSGKRRMDITICDDNLMNSLGAFSPYYTEYDSTKMQSVSDEEIRFISQGTTNQDSKRSYSFYATDQGNFQKETVSQLLDEFQTDPSLSNKVAEYQQDQSAYQEFVNNSYLYVDSGNVDALKEVCEENGLVKESPTIVSDVVNVLSQKYTYTLHPGRVPWGKDFANYFLLNNKKGFCQHFATAATLLYRYLGVPARYVEGYVIDSENVADGETVADANPKEWVDGDTKGQDVVQVDITDTNSHAWVEVYESGVGWVPVEVTLAPSEDDDQGFLSDLLSGDGSGGGNLADTAQNAAKGISVGGGILLIIIPVIYIGRIFFIRIKRRKGFADLNQNLALSRRYYYILQLLAYGAGEKVFHLSYSEISDMLSRDYGISKDCLTNVISCIERANFSKDGMTRSQYESCVENMKMITKQIYQRVSLPKRIMLRCVKGL